MHFHRLIKTFAIVYAVAGLASATCYAQANSQELFQRAFYLQTHEHDLAGAATAYEKVLMDASAPDSLRQETKTRLAQCREDLASADFAELMPAHTMAYFEINNPGEHIGHLVQMLGLYRPHGPIALNKPAGGTPLEDGFFFPDDFSMSPALINELKKIRGLALAVTAIDPNEGPHGVMVLHPGDCDLLRGLAETSAQTLTPAEPIEGFRTYRVLDEAWLTVTARLIVLSREREELAGVLARLSNPATESLADQQAFKKQQDERRGALLFAYANLASLRELFETRLHGEEAAVARTVLDLDHMEAVTAVLRTTETSLEAQLKLDLSEGHHNLVYGLIRTAPLSRRSLAHVPSGVAVVALLGLNPASPESAAAATDAQEKPYVTAMDLGREIFGNIEELALFASAPQPSSATGKPSLPEVGLVLAVKDPAKSEALWNQILALPALFASSTPVQETTIEGVAGKVYSFPDAPPMALVRCENRAIVAGTLPAVAAALRASKQPSSLRTDPDFQPLLERLTAKSSKAVLIHVGRLLPAMGGFMDGSDAEQAQQISEVVKDLRVSLVSDEHPTQWLVRTTLTGLPNVPEIIKYVAGARRRDESTVKVTPGEPVSGEEQGAPKSVDR